MNKYTVSVCLLIKDENSYLAEWLEWHVRQGVEHFYIYDNGSTTPVKRDIPAEYRERCTVVDWAGYHPHTQIDAYANCLSRFQDETEWMAFIDTDEFIRVVDGTPLPEFLGRTEFQEAAAVSMGWVTYNANGLLKRDERPVRERFTTTVEYPAHLPQCKCVVRTEQVRMMGPHHPIRSNTPLVIVDEAGNDHREVARPLPRERLVVDHYFTRSYEEWQEKMARGSCDPSYTRGPEWFELMNPEMAATVAEYVSAG